MPAKRQRLDGLDGCCKVYGSSSNEKLFMDFTSADIMFVCGEEKFPAHKAILSKESKYFHDMFKKCKQTKRYIVKLPRTTPAAFKVFLAIFYLQRADICTAHLKEVNYLSTKYLVSKHRLYYFKIPLEQDSPQHILKLNDNHHLKRFFLNCRILPTTLTWPTCAPDFMLLQ